MSLKQLERNLDKILHENILSGDFSKANFRDKLESFLDFVTYKFPCFDDQPRTTVLELIKGKVVSLTNAGFCPSTKVAAPNVKRIWVTTLYTHLMLDKVFVSQESISEWITEMWPEIQVPEEAVEETFLLLQEYDSARQTRKRTLSDHDSCQQHPNKRQKVPSMNNIDCKNEIL